MSRYKNLIVPFFAMLLAAIPVTAQDQRPWPPELPAAKNGTAMLKTDKFLEIPAAVTALRGQEGVAPFTMAAVPPTIELAYHADLGADAVNRRLWSSWGDICVASDGSVYCAIGDHGDDVGGNARAFLYRFDATSKVLRQVVDLNKIVPRQPGQPAWSKVHAKIDEGPDGKIYFSGTLNDGNRAGKPTHVWSEQLPGGQLYRYDPQTGKAEVFANLPPKRCTATSLLDRERNLWWCNLEAGEGNALFCLNLKTGRPEFQAPDGSLAFNRSFALTRDGSIIYNGTDKLWRWDAKTKQSVSTGSSIGDSTGIRSASHESKQGFLYGTMHKSNQLFRYSPAKDEFQLLGPTWLKGEYTTVMLLSPDERFLYYLPGAHGGAFKTGTPIVQYDLATNQRKVLAFLAPACDELLGYVPAGTYGAKLNADGGTLYVNFNGHAADRLRPPHHKPIGFSLTAFAAIQIPASER